MADETTEYTDPTPISDYEKATDSNIQSLAAQAATDIRHKMYGHDVREALARWVEIGLQLWSAMDDDWDTNKSDMTLKAADQDRKISSISDQQSDIAKQFEQVIAGATKDSEVILARSSEDYGDFGTLDSRLENIESMLATQVPAGYSVTIKHGLNRNPDVSVYYYEDAIGTEPDGLGTAKSFGGTSPIALTASVTYTDSNTVMIGLPAAYALSGTVAYQPGDRCWYLIDGNRILKFDLGVSADENPSSAGGSSTGGTTVDPGGDDNGSGTATTDYVPSGLKASGYTVDDDGTIQMTVGQTETWTTSNASATDTAGAVIIPFDNFSADMQTNMSSMMSPAPESDMISVVGDAVTALKAGATAVAIINAPLATMVTQGTLADLQALADKVTAPDGYLPFLLGAVTVSAAETDDAPAAPTGLSATQISATEERLDWM
ncbi:hypothetical protein [Lacticaseibacillus pantheris]|uniref:hypothetical protein n=1 Tax=Lacticaseibacillus pantheris TaxID=171523 RepID=UPI00265B6F99|nr:hypothetical protein [Lacticaseibacillus pantheris]WKF86030.1 hypothetical protein QY874_05470 [Lacticaseibacillus pantheris]